MKKLFTIFLLLGMLIPAPAAIWFTITNSSVAYPGGTLHYHWAYSGFSGDATSTYSPVAVGVACSAWAGNGSIYSVTTWTLTSGQPGWLTSGNSYTNLDNGRVYYSTNLPSLLTNGVNGFHVLKFKLKDGISVVRFVKVRPK